MKKSAEVFFPRVCQHTCKFMEPLYLLECDLRNSSFRRKRKKERERKKKGKKRNYNFTIVKDFFLPWQFSYHTWATFLPSKHRPTYWISITCQALLPSPGICPSRCLPLWGVSVSQTLEWGFPEELVKVKSRDRWGSGFCMPNALLGELMRLVCWPHLEQQGLFSCKVGDSFVESKTEDKRPEIRQQQ